MNQDKKDAIKLVFVVIGVFGALGLLGYYQYINDLPVKVEGKVIGTYIEASGWSSRTICIIDIDGERYNTSQTCNLIFWQDELRQNFGEVDLANVIYEAKRYRRLMELINNHINSNIAKSVPYGDSCRSSVIEELHEILEELEK